MDARALIPLDLPWLWWMRRRACALDSEQTLLFGSALRWESLYAAMAPGARSAIAVRPVSPRSAAGMRLLPGGKAAALQFWLPASSAADLDATGALYAWLAARALHWGARWLQAAAPPEEQVVDGLQKAGFRPLTWQWTEICLDMLPSCQAGNWRPQTPADWPQIRALYRRTIPAPLRLLEELDDFTAIWVYAPRSEVQACARVRCGPRGCLVYPLFPSHLRVTEQILEEMLCALQRAGAIPLFIRVRSYQEWLLGLLSRLSRPARPRELVLVRSLAHTVPQRRAEERQSAPAPSFQ